MEAIKILQYRRDGVINLPATAWLPVPEPTESVLHLVGHARVMLATLTRLNLYVQENLHRRFVTWCSADCGRRYERLDASTLRELPVTISGAPVHSAVLRFSENLWGRRGVTGSLWRPLPGPREGPEPSGSDPPSCSCEAALRLHDFSYLKTWLTGV